MGNRTMNRYAARKLYDKFSKLWREEKRLNGTYGDPGHKKPSFSHWYAMHERNLKSMEKSSPADVQEYLEQFDPWVDQQPETDAKAYEISPSDEQQRGVMEMSMTGSDNL